MNGKARVIVTDTFYQLYLWGRLVKRKEKGLHQETWKGEVSLIWFYLQERYLTSNQTFDG
jgi:hypothetical protein